MPRSLPFRVFSLITFILGCSATAAWAQSTLHIGFGVGTPCAMGCGGDPNVSGPATDTIDIFQNSSGARSLVNPILMILGVPNTTDADLFDNSSIKSVMSYNSYDPTDSDYTPGTPMALSWNYGGTAATPNPFGLKSSSGYQGNLTNSYKKDVYEFLGLKKVNDSNKFKKWNETFLEWQAQLTGTPGVSASGFGLYVFTLWAPGGVSPLGARGAINVIFSNPRTLPVGTYVIAYGEDALSRPFGTPFTEAGLKSGVPEPSSLLLLSTAAAGVLFLLRRRLARP